MMLGSYLIYSFKGNCIVTVIKCFLTTKKLEKENKKNEK